MSLLNGPRTRKRVSGHMRTAKAQISLRIRAGWSGPSLHVYRIIEFLDTTKWMDAEQSPDDFVHA